MAQNKETLLWHKLKNLNKKWHFTRVESSTMNGIPDVHCVVDGQVFWLELKANDDKNCGLSKWQINWHVNYQKAGGNVFILNNPLLKRGYEIWHVNRGSRTPTHVSGATDLKLLIMMLADRISWQRSRSPEPRTTPPR